MRKNFFLEHPVFSIVISIVIFIIGAIGLMMLPVDQYPQIVPPVVKITASYPGADATTVTQAVATPIEQELNGTPGMIYMSSTSSNSGGFSALVTFDIDTDPELAAVDIQNRVKKAESRLPAEVVQNGISVSKETASRLMTITILSDDPKFDEVYLSNYTTLNVIDPIRRIPGVGSVSNVGGRYYAMQIWLQPDKLADMGLTVRDIQNALKDQNRESAAGALGQAPADDVDVTMPIIARGRLSSVREFEDIVLRASANGSIIRLKDVARISLEAQSYSTESGINGGNAAVININMLPGANAMEVADAVKEEMMTLAESFPAGISYNIPFDMTTYIKESIHHVYRTFFEALILVIVVVFLSLQNWRATLIPVIAVPISLVGTFGVMLLFGFSLNMLTLLGLILAIGIVVDDAIVVVENVDRIMNAEHLPPKEATAKAMQNLGSALVAMSLVLCAVFVPVSFLPGITGQLYRQFTVTIAVSVVISTIVALTLSPVMCATLLKPASHKRKARIFRYINLRLGKGNRYYGRAIRRVLVHPRRMYLAFALTLAFIYMMNEMMPRSFMSQEDQGYFTVELELPEGASIERTREVTDRAMKMLMKDEDVEYVLNVTGSSPRVGTNQAHSQLTVILKPWDKRKTDDITEIRARILNELSEYPESKAYIFSPSIIPGLGTSGGFEMVLEAKADATYSDLQNAVDTLRAYASSMPMISGLSTSMQTDIPQLYFDVDRDRAQMLGIPVSDIFSTMKAFTGSIYVNDFNMFNRIYRVYLQADAPYRMRRDNINLFFVKSSDGTMVPVSSLGNSHFTTGPGTIGRFNMFNSATVSGEAAHGYSTGEAMDALEKTVREKLPPNIGVEWSGLSYQQKHESGNTGLILGLVFIFVFLFLAALYESWSVPLAVILSLPVAGVGAYLGIWLCGLENNIYFQIGLVMLVGLVAKNAILIVEFAKEETDRGCEPAKAVLTAARLRFRPIVMTSLAFMLGLVPLLFASGPGSAARRDIGTGVFFGMAVAITAGIVFVPFFFVQVNMLVKKLKKKKSKGKKNLHASLIILMTIGLLCSCSGTKDLVPARLEMPRTFMAESTPDSLSIADMAWWEFFTDPTLKKIMSIALDNNRDLLKAAAKIEQMRQLYGITKADILPDVGFNIQYSHETNNYNNTGTQNDPEHDLKFPITWEINLWGSMTHARKAGKARFIASQEDYRAMRMELIAEVATAYIRLVALENELDIVRRTLLTRQESLNQAKIRFEGGLTSETVYQQAKVEYATAAALVPDLELRVASTRNALTLLMGEYPHEILDERTFRFNTSLEDKIPIGVPSDLLKRRPDLRAAEQKLKAAMSDVGLSYADRFPSLKIGFTPGFENDGLKNFFKSPFTYVIGSVAGTIFDFGKKKRKYKAAIAVYDQTRYDYEQSVMRAFTEVNTAIVAYDGYKENTRLMTDLCDAAEKYVKLARLQYRGGTLNYIDVLDAQRRYFSAQTGVNNALRDEYLALINLYKTLGGGWHSE